MTEKQNFTWGLTKNAEKLNGRFAMIGLIILILIEIILNRNILSF